MAKYYNLMIVPDGVENPFGIKMRSWLFKTLIALIVVVFVGLLLFFSFYGKIVVRATQANRLEQENEELKRYKYKVGLLEEKMKESREIVNRISTLAGVEVRMPELPPDSILFAGLENARPAMLNRPISAGVNVPAGLPLQGYMTRGFSDDTTDYHPGVDIAAEVGTSVLATAAGKVIFAGEDSVYGQTIIIEHDSSLSTLYGHNNELLVEEGKDVLVGGRIALSGNTGKSTAPHLHYEIRENNKPVNPLKYISANEGSNE
ncbi:MAG: M23 family metallopeptidase [Candidatus Zixiibacteriota bacterium]|nr:MAG: M23 family metallopeptidase [candidate division Zixibacteria bacterium]